jgi:hypothetical protein
MLMAIGDVLTLQIADTSANEGSAGMNQSWDLSGLTPVGAPLTQMVVTVGSTPFASSFPTATLALDAGGGSYAYYTSSASDMTLLGIGRATTVIPYTDPQKFFQYPTTYNTSFTDNLSATYIAGAFPATRTGTVTSLADAYGTLTLPSGVISNVLRIKYVQDITDEINLGTTTSTLHTVTETYYWMTPGNKNALLDISYITTTILGNTTTAKSVYYYPGSVSTQDINASNVKVQLFPNPVVDQATITFNLSHSGNLKLSILNASGQKILEIEHAESGIGQQSFNINLAELASGIYFIAGEIDNSPLFTQQLVKQ